MCQEERDYIRSQGLPAYSWPPATDDASFHNAIIDQLGPAVYISVDLDVLDPALMPSVGTPEPGGMSWQEITALLRRVTESRRVVGFDVCELSPNAGPPACSYTAAKLVYKLIAYTTLAAGAPPAGDAAS